MAALEGTVSVPGGGKVPKMYAAGGLIVVAGLIGIYYYRKRKAAAPAATATDQFPPDGTSGNPSDPYSTDPATGQTYGNEAAGSGGTLGAFPPGSTDTGTGGTGTGTGTGSGGPPFPSNSAWSNWVIQQMQASDPGASAAALIDAIGVYLAGQPVTAAQKTLIWDARAIAGDPPVSGPAGYPPNVRMGGAKGGKTFAGNPVKGIRASRVQKTDATVSWDAEPHAVTFTARITSGKATVRTQAGAGHSTHIGGLRPKTRYEVAVLARPARTGARPATVTFTTL